MAKLEGSIDVVALVPIRGGSKGLQGKNIRLLAGRPLYLQSVEQGIRVLGACVVSTDIVEVLEQPAPEGCCLLRRPSALCGDDVLMDEVIADTIDQLDLSNEVVIVLLQATSPLRSDDDVRAALELYALQKYDLVMSVTSTDSVILKYGMLEDGHYVPVARPEYCFTNRQSLPSVFRPNGAVYAFSVGLFRRNGGLSSQNIGAVVMPESRSIDIDTLADFEAVEARLGTVDIRA